MLGNVPHGCCQPFPTEASALLDFSFLPLPLLYVLLLPRFHLVLSVFPTHTVLIQGDFSPPFFCALKYGWYKAFSGKKKEATNLRDENDIIISISY